MVWPSVSNSRSLKALSQPGNDFHCNTTRLGQRTAFCWGRRVTVRKPTTMQRKVSLGNGCDPLFGTRAWNIVVIREYFPSKTGALPGMIAGATHVSLWVRSVQGCGVFLPVPGMAPPGFWRQIELTNVVTFPQQGKVHQFRKKITGWDLGSSS